MFKNSWLKSAWLKSLGLKILKSRVEMSCNPILVGTSGIIPLILIPQTAQNNQNNSDKENEEKTTQEKKTLNRQLSFAVGGLLGDVFLHLLPESYENGKKIYSC